MLVLRLGAMGDVLHALPAVALLRRMVPSCEIGWVIEERWHELLSSRGLEAIRNQASLDPVPALSPEQPLVNRIHLVNTRAWRGHVLSLRVWGEMQRARRAVRRVVYEAALDFQGAWKSAILSAGSGAGKRVGFAKPREPGAGWFYNQRVEIGRASASHVIEQNVSLLLSAITGGTRATASVEDSGNCCQHGVPKRGTLSPHRLSHLSSAAFREGEAPVEAPPLPVDPTLEDWADRQLRQEGLAEREFAIINPGTGWKAKSWPAERYGEVARGLGRTGMRSVVNFGPDEAGLAQDVVAASGGAAQARRYTIGELIAITRRARLFVGGDTGPMHLAAALRIPVVAVFGPTNPARNGPYATAAEVLRSPESVTNHSRRTECDKAMLSITADVVLAAARSLLERTVAPAGENAPHG